MSVRGESWLSAIDCAEPLCAGEKAFMGIGLIESEDLPELRGVKIEKERKKEGKKEKCNPTVQRIQLARQVLAGGTTILLLLVLTTVVVPNTGSR